MKGDKFFAFYVPRELEEEFQSFIDAGLSFISTYGKNDFTPKERKLIKWLEEGVVRNKGLNK